MVATFRIRSPLSKAIVVAAVGVLLAPQAASADWRLYVASSSGSLYGKIEITKSSGTAFLPTVVITGKWTCSVPQNDFVLTVVECTPAASGGCQEPKVSVQADGQTVTGTSKCGQTATCTTTAACTASKHATAGVWRCVREASAAASANKVTCVVDAWPVKKAIS